MFLGGDGRGLGVSIVLRGLGPVRPEPLWLLEQLGRLRLGIGVHGRVSPGEIVRFLFLGTVPTFVVCRCLWRCSDFYQSLLPVLGSLDALLIVP